MENDLHMDQHISHSFNDELDSLRSRVLIMGGLVEQQCQDALSALLEGEFAIADKVATSDRPINDMEVEINALCTDLLVRRQPAASDLRMILAVIRLTADLERIGDEAEKIGRLTANLVDNHERQSYFIEPKNLGEGVLAMLHGALDAFARLDVDAAIALAGRDPEIDREFESLTRLLISHMMEEPEKVKTLLRVNWCARALERIGDHAVNICEEVIYLVKGEDVRHLSLATIEAMYSSNR